MRRESINDYYIDFRGSIKWVCIVCTFFPNLIILDDAETMKKKKIHLNICISPDLVSVNTSMSKQFWITNCKACITCCTCWIVSTIIGKFTKSWYIRNTRRNSYISFLQNTFGNTLFTPTEKYKRKPVLLSARITSTFDQRSKTKSITKLSLPLLLAGKQPNYLLAKSLLSPRNIGRSETEEVAIVLRFPSFLPPNQGPPFSTAKREQWFTPRRVFTKPLTAPYVKITAPLHNHHSPIRHPLPPPSLETRYGIFRGESGVDYDETWLPLWP